MKRRPPVWNDPLCVDMSQARTSLVTPGEVGPWSTRGIVSLSSSLHHHKSDLTDLSQTALDYSTLSSIPVMPEQTSTTGSDKPTKAPSRLRQFAESVLSVVRHSLPPSTTARRSTRGSNIDPSSPDGLSKIRSTNKPFPTSVPNDHQPTLNGKDHPNSDGTNYKKAYASDADPNGVEEVAVTEHQPEDPDAITPAPSRDSHVHN
jgi:hypothetical protein